MMLKGTWYPRSRIERRLSSAQRWLFWTRNTPLCEKHALSSPQNVVYGKNSPTASWYCSHWQNLEHDCVETRVRCVVSWMGEVDRHVVRCVEPKEMEVTGSHTANRTCDWLRRYGWEVTDHPPDSPDPAPIDFQLLGSHKKHLVGSDLQQTPTWSKLSHPFHIQLTTISSTLVYKPWCHGGTNVLMSLVTT